MLSPSKMGFHGFERNNGYPLAVFGSEGLVGHITRHGLHEGIHLGSRGGIFRGMLRPQPRTEYGYDHISFHCSIRFKSCPMRARFNDVAKQRGTVRDLFALFLK
jgi:hypothetical protein